jgi:hypothetical protein
MPHGRSKGEASCTAILPPWRVKEELSALCWSG